MQDEKDPSSNLNNKWYVTLYLKVPWGSKRCVLAIFDVYELAESFILQNRSSLELYGEAIVELAEEVYNPKTLNDIPFFRKMEVIRIGKNKLSEAEHNRRLQERQEYYESLESKK